MNRIKDYTFRKATLHDLPLLSQWQSTPHVRQWWDDDALYDEDEIKDQRVARWIVEFGGKPFAYMQDYSVHGWGEHHFSHLPKGSRGIDQFIGDPDMVGRGHGSVFIQIRMKFLFEAGAKVIATDPHPDNNRAIAVYSKLGFQISGAPQETEWGLILPMIATSQSPLADD